MDANVPGQLLDRNAHMEIMAERGLVCVRVATQLGSKDGKHIKSDVMS